MTGLGRIVVGYRKGSRKIRQLSDLYGIECVETRQCMAGCGYPIFFASGGVDAVRDRDAEVICAECKELYYPELLAEL